MAAAMAGLLIGIPMTVASLLAYRSWRRRRRFLSALPHLSKAGLERLVSDVLEAPTTALVVDPKQHQQHDVTIDGVRAGETVRLTAGFGPIFNQQYLANGQVSSLVAEMKLTVGLRGATPRLTIRAIEEAKAHYGEWSPTIDDLERAWVFEMEENLADAVIDIEQIGPPLMELRHLLPGVKSIEAHRGGLTITWVTTPGGVSPPHNISPDFLHDQAGLTLATDLLIALRQRVLTALEEPARMRVGVGYRDGPLAPTIDGEATAPESQAEGRARGARE